MNMEEIQIDDEPGESDIKQDDSVPDTGDTSKDYVTVYTEETLNDLRDGVLGIYQPPFEQFKSQLEELTVENVFYPLFQNDYSDITPEILIQGLHTSTKQNILIEQLHNENLNLVQKQNSEEFQEIFKRIQMYRNKLINMKTDMKNLHDKSQKLVKRAVRLQLLKEKDDLAKQEQRDKEVKLIGSTSSSTES